MIEKVGKVIEVFIPEEYKEDRLIDVMDSTKIGFKVKVEEEIIEIIQEQDEYNAYIMKNDIVVVRKENDKKEFVDIEIYEGDVYE